MLTLRLLLKLQIGPQKSYSLSGKFTTRRLYLPDA